MPVRVHDDVEGFKRYEAVLVPAGSLVILCRSTVVLNFRGRSDGLNIRLRVQDRSFQALVVLFV